MLVRAYLTPTYLRNEVELRPRYQVPAWMTLFGSQTRQDITPHDLIHVSILSVVNRSHHIQLLPGTASSLWSMAGYSYRTVMQSFTVFGE